MGVEPLRCADRQLGPPYSDAEPHRMTLGDVEAIRDDRVCEDRSPGDDHTGENAAHLGSSQRCGPIGLSAAGRADVGMQGGTSEGNHGQRRRSDVVVATAVVASADELARAWPEADYVVVPDAGHSAMEPGIRRALVAATQGFKAPS